MLAEPVGADEALPARPADPAGRRRRARCCRPRRSWRPGSPPGPTVAYGAIKRELLVGDAGTLADALAAEAQAQAICGATADHRNATAAFVAKEKPTFDRAR